MSGKFATTLGYERRHNPAFRQPDRESFIRYMSEGLPERPANIRRIVALNQGRLPATLEEPEIRSVTPKRASRMLQENPALRIIDMREPGVFGECHIPGSVNIPLSSSEFEQRIGWVFEPEIPFLLLGEKNAAGREAIHRMAFLGLDSGVQGFIRGGMKSWTRAGLPHAAIPQISVAQLHQSLSENGGTPWRVVDVREDEEWREGHIRGACHKNYKVMGKDKVDLPFSQQETLAVVCARGVRSSTGASLLKRHGYNNVLNVVGGMTAWRRAGFEMTSDN